MFCFVPPFFRRNDDGARRTRNKAHHHAVVADPDDEFLKILMQRRPPSDDNKKQRDKEAQRENSSKSATSAKYNSSGCGGGGEFEPDNNDHDNKDIQDDHDGLGREHREDVGPSAADTSVDTCTATDSVVSSTMSTTSALPDREEDANDLFAAKHCRTEGNEAVYDALLEGDAANTDALSRTMKPSVNRVVVWTIVVVGAIVSAGCLSISELYALRRGTTRSGEFSLAQDAVSAVEMTTSFTEESERPGTKPPGMLDAGASTENSARSHLETHDSYKNHDGCSLVPPKNNEGPDTAALVVLSSEHEGTTSSGATTEERSFAAFSPQDENRIFRNVGVGAATTTITTAPPVPMAGQHDDAPPSPNGQQPIEEEIVVQLDEDDYSKDRSKTNMLDGEVTCTEDTIAFGYQQHSSSIDPVQSLSSNADHDESRASQEDPAVSAAATESSSTDENESGSQQRQQALSSSPSKQPQRQQQRHSPPSSSGYYYNDYRHNNNSLYWVDHCPALSLDFGVIERELQVAPPPFDHRFFDDDDDDGGDDNDKNTNCYAEDLSPRTRRHHKSWGAVAGKGAFLFVKVPAAGAKNGRDQDNVSVEQQLEGGG